MSDTVDTQSAAINEPRQTMDILEIMSVLPHRYPFLLIDRIIEIERRKRIVAIKNVTATEPHFLGHFPGYPIMPGVLIVEAMAQSGGALLMPEFPNRDELLMLFTSIEDAKFRLPVVPGDQVRIEVTIRNWRRLAVKLRGIATVDGKIVCEANLMCMLVDNPVNGTRKTKAAQITEQTTEEKPETPAATPQLEAVLS